MAIKFGTKQLQNPTPSQVANVIDIYCAVAGVLIAWITTAGYIPSNASNIIASILGLGIGICQALKPFFGVRPTSNNVPVEDVKTIDTSDK